MNYPSLKSLPLVYPSGLPRAFLLILSGFLTLVTTAPAWSVSSTAIAKPASTTTNTTTATTAPSTAPDTQPSTLPSLPAAVAGGGWTNVTGNVGGEKWGFAGVTALAAKPGSDVVIAGVSESGLWQTLDRGKTWKRLGEKNPEQIHNRPYQIIFDPADNKIFWESGNYGPGIFQTTDDGVTFRRLGQLDHVDGLGIDFTDSSRKTLVCGLHETERSIQKSADHGATWTRIGDKLPEKTNISNDVIVIDANTYIVNAAGWKRDSNAVLGFGIFRTEDGGKTFAKVSEAGPSGPALVAADKTIYWQTLWGAGLIKSADHGKSWQKLNGPVKANPIEITGGKLVAAVDAQLMVSADAGQSWQKLGEPIPFKPTGLAYSAGSRSIYAWRSTDAKEENVIVRWDLP